MKKQTKQTKKTTKTIAAKQLDEETSTRVIAEYLQLSGVTGPEIDGILNRGSARGPRDIALTFRVSELLDIPAPFKIAPRYQLAFERAREYIQLLSGVATKLKQADAAEARA